MKELTWFGCTENGIRKVSYIVLSEADRKLTIVKKNDGNAVMFNIHELDIGKVKLSGNGIHASIFLLEDDMEKAVRLVKEQVTKETKKLRGIIMNYAKVIHGLDKYPGDPVQNEICEHLDKSSIYPVNLKMLNVFSNKTE